MNAPLYNREILALAVALADFQRLAAPTRTGELRAPLCGSRIILDLMLAADGRIDRVGLSVQACALGQAAATLFARAALGRTTADLAAVHRALAAWLAGDGKAAPHWPGIAVLAPARAYPARHAAILLPFALAAQLTNETVSA
jgi:NifU-like protein involved in Fe-S cluster formation